MAQTKYTDGSGVSEIWLNIKNYVYSQLLGKQDTLGITPAHAGTTPTNAPSPKVLEDHPRSCGNHCE